MSEQKTIRVDSTMFAGAVSFEEGEGWIKPWRLPFADVSLFPPDDTISARAEMSAGVRLRFRSDTSSVSVSVVPSSARRLFDLTVGGDLVCTAVLDAGADSVVFDTLDSGVKDLEIWLPQGASVCVRGLGIDDSASISVVPDERKRWITYGSSITHCNAAHSPSRTWPATAARSRGLDLVCLGYGGQCHLDPMVGRMIRDLSADFISLKLGINVNGGATLSPRTFRPAIIGLVKTIREGHPEIPMVVVSPIVSPPREERDNAVGLSLRKMRVEVADAVRRLREAGDGNLHYLDGLELFDPAWVDAYLPDDLHPNGDGYELMGNRAADRIIDRYFLS